MPKHIKSTVAEAYAVPFEQLPFQPLPNTAKQVWTLYDIIEDVPPIVGYNVDVTVTIVERLLPAVLQCSCQASLHLLLRSLQAPK